MHIDGSKYPGAQLRVAVAKKDGLSGAFGFSFADSHGNLTAGITENRPQAPAPSAAPAQNAPEMAACSRGSSRRLLAPAPAQALGNVQTVQEGDSMYKIWQRQAQPSGVTWDEFRAANAHIFQNPITRGGNLIHPGDQVVVPRADSVCIAQPQSPSYGRLERAAPRLSAPRVGAFNISTLRDPSAHLLSMLDGEGEPSDA
jgi:hypothetical protein